MLEAKIKENLSILNSTNFITIRTLLMKKLCISNKLANLYIAEYKKFLMMATLSKQMITPSEQVDQVWHLHLTMAANYLGLVKSLGLGYFDHHPTIGGVQYASQ